MAVSAILIKQDATVAAAITLGGLESSTAGLGRQATLLANTLNRPAALVTVKLKSGAVAPTAGTVYEVRLIRSVGGVATDSAGAVDAAFTAENAGVIGTLVVTATANKVFSDTFDTGPTPLGASWAPVIINASGQALSAVEADHSVQVTYYYPEAQ